MMEELLRHLDYVQGGIAAALVVAAIVAGWALSRAIGPRLRKVWESRAGYESELAGRRIRDMVRRATEFILCGLFLYGYSDWPLLGATVLSIPIAVAAGLFTNDLITDLAKGFAAFHKLTG